MQTSETIADLATALAKAQAQIKPASKDATNPHYKSRYADLPAVWEACRKPLTDNGLSVIQMPVDAGEGRVGLTSILLHTSGQYVSSTVSTKLTQDSAQGLGSALTYLRRYALAALVGIVADEDDDGNAASTPRQNGSAAYSAPASHQPNNGNGKPNGSSADKASEKQIKMLFAIWNNGGFDGKLSEWVQTNYRCKIDELTRQQASEAIGILQPSEDVPA